MRFCLGQSQLVRMQSIKNAQRTVITLSAENGGRTISNQRIITTNGIAKNKQLWSLKAHSTTGGHYCLLISNSIINKLISRIMIAVDFERRRMGVEPHS
jgi:hypothetical protein